MQSEGWNHVEQQAQHQQGESDDDFTIESSEEDLTFPEEDLDGPATDELAQRLYEYEEKQLRQIDRLKRRKKHLKDRLAAYKLKEKEFVAQMDAHMDEVESTEQELTARIAQLTDENQQLRQLTDKRAAENAAHLDKLTETTKQCSESETRVQFLVDRIVTLLSAGSADPAQVEAVVNMRQREREVLRHLEETRQQFDEVRQQNGELTSRLTEELSLSRRLADQLAEVEERFFHNRAEPQPVGCDGASPPLRGGRLGPRPTMGLRSDQTEAPPERNGPHVPELPPPISESEEQGNPSIGMVAEASEVQLAERNASGGGTGQRCVLGAVPEADVEALQEEDDEVAYQDSQAFGGEKHSATITEDETWNGQGVSTELLVDVGTNEVDVHQPPSQDLASSSVSPPSARYLPISASPEAVAVMEQKLREALDSAAFECPVTRVDTGIYSFGPSVTTMVDLTPEGEVVALRTNGSFERIDEFIRKVAEEHRRQPEASAPYVDGLSSNAIEQPAAQPVEDVGAEGVAVPTVDLVRASEGAGCGDREPTDQGLIAAPAPDLNAVVVGPHGTPPSAGADSTVGSEDVRHEQDMPQDLGSSPPNAPIGAVEITGVAPMVAGIHSHRVPVGLSAGQLYALSPTAGVAGRTSGVAQWPPHPSSVSGLTGVPLQQTHAAASHFGSVPSLGPQTQEPLVGHAHFGTAGRTPGVPEVASVASSVPRQVVKPLQLHASSVAPLLGVTKSQSSTPERLRGMHTKSFGGSAAASATAMSSTSACAAASSSAVMGQLMSPRPHAAQRPSAGIALAPRVLLTQGPPSGSVGAMRVGVLQQPSFTPYCTLGQPPTQAI